MVVAAMKILDGERINWAQLMLQRMFENIEAKRGRETQTIELFAAFYISVLCEEPPIPSTYHARPSSLGSTPSSLFSLEKSNQKVAKNRRLRLHVQNLQTMVDTK